MEKKQPIGEKIFGKPTKLEETLEKISSKTPLPLQVPLWGVGFWLIVGEMIVDSFKPNKSKK